ncbi:MAG: GNAT family N-acetyltransferase [Anaerolineales bacterium]|nr:GNAT family N-acetyltransferase [Chloroflexota bacterium]MBL6981095.1 GNAT family N-acetyltransferase [Anaerolineales bacterium]
MSTLQLPKNLGDNLILRWATPADNEQLLELTFHALDEGEEEYPFVKIFVQDWIDGKFPILKHEAMTVVEDTNTSKLVSSMCLFSSIWRYGETEFKVGRPELVMTHEDYRRRGLISKQFEVIHALSEARGEVMQVITGIPSLYRAFDYELCLELGGGYRIYPPSFPKLKGDLADDYRLREPVSDADRAFIKDLHKTNTRAMLFSMDVPDPIWDFEFGGYTDGSDGKFHWLVIENKAGEPLGYLHHDHVFWGPVMDINFLALKPGVGYLNLLPHLLHGLWNIAQRKFVDDNINHPAEEIRGLYLRLGRDHPLYDAIGRDLMLKAPAYAWYTRFLDETAYLNAIKPQLEKHVAESTAGAGFTGELKLNFYNRGTHLKFQEGRLEIESWLPPNGSAGHAHFPANSFWSVMCGQKKASQLAIEIADCWMSRTAQVLLDCIFPEFNGQVWVMGGGG